eukprot:20318_1
MRGHVRVLSQQLNTLSQSLTLSLSVTKCEHGANILLVSNLATWSIDRSFEELKQFHDTLCCTDMCRGIYLPTLPDINTATSSDYQEYLSKILGRIVWFRLDFVLKFVEAPLQFRRVVIARYKKEKRVSVRSGLLKKEGEKNKSYSKRYFVVLPNYVIAYFDNKQSFEDNKSPKGHIDLLSVSSISNGHVNKKFAFHLSTPNRVWKLQCRNEQEQNDWIQFLNAYVSSNKYDAFILPHRPYNTLPEPMDTNVEELFLSKNIKQCTVAQCDAVYRIGTVLKYHYELTKAMDYKNKLLFYLRNMDDESEEKHDDKGNDILYNYINQQLYPYTTLRLLNDYFHVIVNHKHPYESYDNLYEQITSCIGTSCDIALCKCFERIETDAIKCTDHDTHTYKTDKEGGTLHILDQMHCYFLHSYDVAMALPQKEWTQIQNNTLNESKQQTINDTDRNQEFERMKQLVIHKKKTLLQTCEFSSIHYGFKHNNKFMTSSISAEVQTANVAHVFGYKFFYWEYYQRNDASDLKYNVGHKISDFYIQPKHKDMKSEVLPAMNTKQWDYLIRKGHSLLKCDVIKKLKANHMVVIDHLDSAIELESVITISHVLAILIYTNRIELQRDLALTYSKKTGDESLECMKQRHANYGHWARYLSETVHVYGNEWMHRNNEDEPLYHGINTLMYFTDSIIHFNYLISCSESLVVATSYLATSNDGLILKLTDIVDDNHNALKIHCFNCSIFSDFCFEDEYLLDASWSGVHVGVQMDTIFHVGFSTIYGSHLDALRVVNDIFKGIWMKTPLSAGTRSLINMLITNELKNWLGIEDKTLISDANMWNCHSTEKLPQYVELSFHCLTHEIESVVVDVASLMMKKQVMNGVDCYGYWWLGKLLMDDQLYFVNMAILIHLFPKCKSLKIVNSVSMDGSALKFELNNKILNMILMLFESLEFKQSTEWKQIKMCGFVNPPSSIQKLCSNFEELFRQHGWNLQCVFGSEGTNKMVIVLQRVEQKQ